MKRLLYSNIFTKFNITGLSKVIFINNDYSNSDIFLFHRRLALKNDSLRSGLQN